MAGLVKSLSIPVIVGNAVSYEVAYALFEADRPAYEATARKIFPDASEVNDEATCDLLTQRIQLHEKNAWMLRVLLDD